MSIGNTPRDDADLEAFLARQSPVSEDYDNLELVEPPTTLDEKILAAARVAAKSVQSPATQPAGSAAAASVSSAIPPDPVERRKRSRPPAPTAGDDDDAVPSRRPPWLVPAALAASVLVVLGVGFAIYMNTPSGTTDSPLDSSLFAKRARERSEEDKAVAAAAATTGQDAEVVELELAPLPPPPVFEVEGPQVQDLDAAIALIRKDLLLANQVAASQEEASRQSPDLTIAAAPAGKLADAIAPTTPVAPAAASVVQPRERRLTKILELYDGGNPDLAGDSLEIFLRDFEDDPISQRILVVKP